MKKVQDREYCLCFLNIKNMSNVLPVEDLSKEELQLVMFPNLKITFEELFDLGEY